MDLFSGPKRKKSLVDQKTRKVHKPDRRGILNICILSAGTLNVFLRGQF